jgi:fructose 1,6-bisphosphate aldolase/phosphatase
MLEVAGAMVDAQRGRVLRDGQVKFCGDDLALIMVHDHGAYAIHAFAWDVFRGTTNVAEELGLYGAGQDILSDAFSGNLRGMGPGFAEITFEERPSEPIVVFLADKTESGTWKLPLYKMFVDPFNTIGLVIDPKIHDGFLVEVHDLFEEKWVVFDCPAELYHLLLFIGAPSRCVIKAVTSKTLGATAAVTSTQRLALMAGRYVGKDDPVMIVRSQSGLPALGEVLEPFALAHAVAGCTRGSHHAPLMPVPLEYAHPTRFDGPPRVVALGLSTPQRTSLVGPRDLVADPLFDNARQQALNVYDYFRRLGRSNRTGCRSRRWSTRQCPKSPNAWPTGGNHSHRRCAADPRLRPFAGMTDP